MKTYYYLYEIRNNLNGKIYVGVHKTTDMNDGYMGSGKIIRSAITKHGISNFSKVILEQFEDAAAMYAREKEVVTDEFLLREDTYNLRRGGTGGFDYINKNGKNNNGIPFDRELSEIANRRLIELQRSNPERMVDRIKKFKDTTKNYDWKSIASAGSLAASEANKRLMWITDGPVNKKISKDCLVPCGWAKGRVGKFTNKRYMDR